MNNRKPGPDHFAHELLRLADEHHGDREALACNMAACLRSAVRNGVHLADLAFELDRCAGLSPGRAEALRNQAMYSRAGKEGT